MKRLIILSVVILFTFIVGRSVKAQPPSIQILGGYVLSPVINHKERPDFDYLMLNLRFSWFRHRGISSLMEATYSDPVRGSQGYMVGGTLFLRYEKRLSFNVIPYIQVGIGILYNDIYRDRSQDLIGNSIEFTPQGGMGFRWPIDKRTSIDTEFIYHHISNADISERNVGVNGVGIFIGITYNFRLQ